MKQSFLDSLTGMILSEAVTACKQAGHKVSTIPSGMATTMIARPNTVMLWYKDDAVNKATAGDPFDLV